TNFRLQKSNAELEQFAYVASHDLQEPLRKIKTFAGMLMGSGITLDTKQQNFLDKIVSASERMSVLINDILNFSKLANKGMPYDKVNLDKVLSNVMEDLELEIEKRQVNIRAEDLPEIQAIPIQMNQLFFNLLGNSLKFSKPDAPLVIKVASRDV